MIVVTIQMDQTQDFPPFLYPNLRDKFVIAYSNLRYHSLLTSLCICSVALQKEKSDSKPSLDSKMDGQDSDDPKQSTADMTAFVQNLLQQMQSRFQAMSDSIMGSRIDELEQSINDLRTEMGVEGSPSSSGAPRPKPEESKSPVDSA
ncbi:hypothetical protein VitviT2T_006335 [Vitis vinifera]|uniref:Heat shock factor-binding protein 1 n=1 Tax=Vitis vinifera TaxID=29760 RepID=A0ABY9BVI1_VITVI|nr:hypothetical protein VitviT2T_006335 [Vitis vinifera]